MKIKISKSIIPNQFPNFESADLVINPETALWWASKKIFWFLDWWIDVLFRITTDHSATPDLKDLFENYNQHLNDADIKYFRHWVSCIFLEFEDKMRKNKDSDFLWLKTPQQRFQLNLPTSWNFSLFLCLLIYRYEEGTCLADLQLAAPPKTLETSWKFQYTFKQ